MSHRITFTRRAQADLDGLYDFIADRADAAVALRYIERLEQ